MELTRLRIFTALLGTETNSFAPFPTSANQFEPAEQPSAAPGPPRYHPYGQVLRVLRERAESDNLEIFQGRGGFASPSGLTTRAAYETLRDRLLEDLRSAMPVDAVALSLHGAMIADGYDTAEGDLLRNIRAVVGPNVPIGAELDPHAHLDDEKLAHSDILVFFKEYPHSDVYERAVEMIDMTLRMTRGEIKPIKSVNDLHTLGNFHTTREPVRSFVARMKAAEEEEKVLSVSFIHSFPWGDSSSLGAKILVITDDAKERGDSLCAALAEELLAIRGQAQVKFLSPIAALERALAVNGAPVILADAADNAGGGAASDSTFVLKAMLELNVENACLGPLYDPGAVTLCHSAGAGAHLKLRIGGKFSAASGDPLDVDVEVLNCTHNLLMLNVFGGPDSVALGPAAAIRVGGVDVVLTSKRQQALGDLFNGVGVDWRTKKIVVVKSAQHFHAVFGPSAAEVLYIDTPGSVTNDWTTLKYVRRPQGLWPLDDNSASSPSSAGLQF
ncbi:MAG: M81 family metallopeptidase [Caulobacteraceae bacterium]|nr:M81 family metallopeptidase [Caulobacteraceae bacterium]